MTLLIDRRSLILTGTLGLGALLIPGFALAATEGGFTHSVASGEPAADSVLLWTRYVGGEAGTTLKCEVAETPDFARVVAGGEQITGPWRDGTVKVTVRGLRAGTVYHYRFIAPDGSMSPVGRTKTLPADGARTWRAAIFSCSNMGYGWFNAYGHAAARADLDCSIHLGDYFYEYASDHYPLAKDVGWPSSRAGGRDAPPRRLPPPLRQLPQRPRSPAASRHAADDRAVGRSRERQRQLGGRRAEPRPGHRGRLVRPPRRRRASLSRMDAGL